MSSNQNFFNRLSTYNSGTADLSYDAVGRLYEVDGSAITRFQYDGQDMVAEYNSSGTLLRRYVHGPGVDEPIVWYEGTGTSNKRWLMPDERGSIVAVTNSSGAKIHLNKYDEHGIETSGRTDRFQYTGQMWIDEVGLYSYKARFYHAELGRFMQTDPIGYAAGMNLYAYVSGDPINSTDPSGMVDTITVTGSYRDPNAYYLNETDYNEMFGRYADQVIQDIRSRARGDIEIRTISKYKVNSSSTRLQAAFCGAKNIEESADGEEGELATTLWYRDNSSGTGSLDAPGEYGYGSIYTQDDPNRVDLGLGEIPRGAVVVGSVHSHKNTMRQGRIPIDKMRRGSDYTVSQREGNYVVDQSGSVFEVRSGLYIYVGNTSECEG